MNRRRFLQLTAAAIAGASALPAMGQTQPTFHAYVLDLHRSLLDGFYRIAEATSKDFVACDFPDGTKLQGCCTPSGKTYVSVARMLPSLALDPDTKSADVLRSIFRHAFDPAHPDFWGYAPPGKATQRSVEAALVAYALVRCDRKLIEQLTPVERSNIQKWLASCTQVPERKTNHAWFTAINHAARLELSRSFPEFAGDEEWMLDDLAALDAMYGKGTDGWYSDSPDQPIYDLYAFYVFAPFPLLWSRVIGQRYPDWNDKFRARVKLFLEKAPHFFAANGMCPLMGRSLIYRWAVLTPLVLGYQQGLWPHSAGLLKRVVRLNLEAHWKLGAFDEKRGKLRETYSDVGSPNVGEAYIDNGHPYWCMLAFSMLEIPPANPFWTADEEPLPVEKGDFVLRFEGPTMLLAGWKRTGEVRWMQAQNSAKRDIYRDKYSKFVWSSHFPFNVSIDPDHVPSDQALVFVDLATGKEATRAPNGVIAARLLDDGVETTWFAQLGPWRIDVISTIQWIGEHERRTHRVTAPPDALNKVLVREGSYASPDASLTNLVSVAGHVHADSERLDGANLVHRTVTTKTIAGRLTASPATFESIESIAPLPRTTDRS